MDGEGVEVSGVFDAIAFENGSFGVDGDNLIDLREAEREREVDGLADGEIEAFADEAAEVGSPRSDAIGAEGQEEPAEAAFVIGMEDAGEVGAGVEESDIGAGNGAAGGIGHNAFDGSRIRLGLREA